MSAERQPEQGERCQLCGSLIEVVSSDEGTSCYRPASAEQGDVNRKHSGNIPELNSTRTPQEATGVEQGDVEAAFKDLRAHTRAMRVGVWNSYAESADVSLDVIQAALERAARERDEAKRNQFRNVDRGITWKQRAEKAERALAKIEISEPDWAKGVDENCETLRSIARAALEGRNGS